MSRRIVVSPRGGLRADAGFAPAARGYPSQGPRADSVYGRPARFTVYNHARTFLGNLGERGLQRTLAVALRGTEHIAHQAARGMRTSTFG